MSISKKLIHYLDKSGYTYEIIPHKVTYTAWDTSETQKVKPQEVAKALLVKMDRDYGIIVVPAHRKLDKAKSLKTINVLRKKSGQKVYKKLELAKEVWMKKNIPGKVGAIAPFGEFLNLPVYIDKMLLKNKKIYVGSGEYTSSLKIVVSQYIKKESALIGDFSAKK